MNQLNSYVVVLLAIFTLVCTIESLSIERDPLENKRMLTEILTRGSSKSKKDLEETQQINLYHRIIGKRQILCDRNDECSNGQLCCSNAPGTRNGKGRCYDPTTEKCCASDGNITSIANVGANEECCQLFQNNQVRKCSNSKCSTSHECTSSCSSNSQCNTGQGESCCSSQLGNSLSLDGGRCAKSTEFCCYDGRVCNSTICHSIVPGGQCCSVNDFTKTYRYCEPYERCDYVNQELKCVNKTDSSYTTSPKTSSFGTTSNDDTTSVASSSSTGLVSQTTTSGVIVLDSDENEVNRSSDDGSGNNTGLIIGVVVGGVIFLAIVVAIVGFFVVRHMRKLHGGGSNGRSSQNEHLVQPNFNQTTGFVGSQTPPVAVAHINPEINYNGGSNDGSIYAPFGDNNRLSQGRQNVDISPLSPPQELNTMSTPTPSQSVSSTVQPIEDDYMHAPRYDSTLVPPPYSTQ